MGDCGFSQDNILLLKSIWEDAYGADKNGLQEQPVTDCHDLEQGLEEEIEEMYQALFGTDIINRKEMLYKETFNAIARHFYELGCRRTAVMYDDIEYERQRAEEKQLAEEPEEDLGKEIEKCLKQYNMLAVGKKDFTDIARHFAEWGAEHLKK